MTPEQFGILKAAVIADPVAVLASVAGDTYALRDWCNAPSTVIVWRPFANGDAVRNAVLWANMTMAAAPDGTALYTNRALYAQSKQISLQTIVQGRDAINTGVAGIRAGLQDCLTALPTKIDGTDQAAGWAAVRTVIQRPATKAEALFAQGTGTTASPSDLVVEGSPSESEINRLVS